MKMEKIVTTLSYGLCVVSLENLQEFLKEEKIRTKKLLSFFQKKDKKYLLSQQNGVWMPIPQINAGKYIIKVKGIDMPFDDEFEELLEYELNRFHLGSFPKLLQRFYQQQCLNHSLYVQIHFYQFCNLYILY